MPAVSRVRACSVGIGAPRMALVDRQEGFRAMTHAAGDMETREGVAARFVAFGGLTIPFCERPGA